MPSLVKLARSGRPIVAVDGCPLDCVRRVLERHGLIADAHHRLADRGVAKARHHDYAESVVLAELDALRPVVASLRTGGQS